MQENQVFPNYNLDDILFLVHGNKIIKCTVQEIIIQQGKTITTIKYNVRPYGIDKIVPIPEENLYRTLDEAKNTVKNTIEKMYQETIEGLNQLTEDLFDKAENQLNQKEQ